MSHIQSYVVTRCVVRGADETIADMLRHVVVERPEDGKPVFDFNRVVPMPTSLKGADDGMDVNLGIEVLTGLPRIGRYGFMRSCLLADWVKELGIETIFDLDAYVREHRPEALAEGAIALHRFAETGFYDRYDWAVENWGTKLNSFEYRLGYAIAGEMEFEFRTCGAMPVPVMEQLAKQYPGLVFSVSFFDGLHDDAIESMTFSCEYEPPVAVMAAAE